MIADSPPKIVKFGMATDETVRIVECHHALMEERKLLAGGVHAHNLRIACIAKALLDGQPVPLAPAAATEPVPEPLPLISPPAVTFTERARPDNLRERLGLR